MDQSRLAPAVGAVASLLLAGVVFGPYVVVTGVERTLGAYYAAGPVGVAGVGFLALLSVVVFMAGRDGATPADTAAGIAVVVGVAELLLAATWAVGLSDALVYSFPARYSWMAYHRYAVAGGAVLAAGAGGWYAYVVAGTGAAAGVGGVGGD
ncbi:MAG: hypothetical protein ABEJ79_09880 [Halolamina sp.]